jgi:hypothetical protein
MSRNIAWTLEEYLKKCISAFFEIFNAYSVIAFG